MKVFISWSKNESHELALALRDWLPDVIQQLVPWVSSEDIDKGQRWSTEVGANLNETSQGILCVTPENLSAPWLNFEAGALAKSLDDARVRPVLLRLRPSEVVGPLAQFQATVVTDRADMLKLATSLNQGCPASVEPSRLERQFDRTWEDFLTRVQAIESSPGAEDGPAKRTPDDLLAEILERVRTVQRSIEQPAVTSTSTMGISFLANPVTKWMYGTGTSPVERGTVGLLGDRSTVALGARVLHPTHGAGRIEGVADNVPDPSDPPLIVIFEEDGARLVQAHELRRLPGPSID